MIIETLNLTDKEQLEKSDVIRFDEYASKRGWKKAKWHVHDPRIVKIVELDYGDLDYRHFIAQGLTGIHAHYRMRKKREKEM